MVLRPMKEADRAAEALSPEEIIAKLRKVDVLLGEDKKVLKQQRQLRSMNSFTRALASIVRRRGKHHAIGLVDLVEQDVRVVAQRAGGQTGSVAQSS